LQSAGGRPRLPLGNLVNIDAFDKVSDDPYAAGLLQELHVDQTKIEAGGYRCDFATP
jgi:hypothetical protein